MYLLDAAMLKHTQTR